MSRRIQRHLRIKTRLLEHPQPSEIDNRRGQVGPR
jgi:hypothetical protein